MAIRELIGRRVTAVSLGACLLVSGCTITETTAPETASTSPGRDISASEDLMVIGDWGAGTAAQDAVAEAMSTYAENTGAILTTGDNFYSDSADVLMEPFRWATDRDIPFVVSWGNHDVDTQARIDAVNETLGNPPRWTTHEWGPVDIVILDSTQVDSSDQVDYLDDTLAASDDPTVVVSHHPPYSCGSHGDTGEIVDEWVSRFDEDVFLVLSGHEHNYQRFESESVTYVVTGGGGASLTELEECPADHVPRVAGEAVHNFVVLELSEGLSVTAIDASGNTVDEFTLTLP